MALKKKTKITVWAVRLLSLLGILAFPAFYLICGRNMDIDDLLSYSPKNLFLAALFLIFLYAVKSLSVFFPIILLEIAGGVIFPVGTAIFVNIIGNAVCFTLPYLIGRFSGNGLADYIIKKRPKLEELYLKQKKNELFLSFFLRAVSCLPGDIVSMYLGSLGVFYPVFLMGSLAGSLFYLTAATVVGDSILDPLSPEFIISAAATFLIAAGAGVIHMINQKYRRV